MTTKDEIVEALKKVEDPEIGMNIVDLGLVYGVDYDDKSGEVQVDLTLTSPGCPLGPELTRNVRNEVRRLDGVNRVNVNLVWNPPWDPSRMSEYAKEELGWDEELGLSYTYY